MEKLIHRAVWSPKSYRNFRHKMEYFQHNNPIFKHLSSMAPIVQVQKIRKAKQFIKNCQEGKQGLLHIGDCAEPFQHSQNSIFQKKLSFLQHCQKVISDTKKKPVKIIGRIAGQYAKPRSSQYIYVQGVKIHNYKGDNVNGQHIDDRNPCQKKLLQGYNHSLNSAKIIQQRFPQLFISHQGLILPYQQSLTRQHEGKFYCQSAHMIWIGERTRQIDGAHVEFFRGIQNPIGVKVSNNINQEQFSTLVRTLNPKNQKGKLLVIVRMGKQKIKSKLQNLIKIKKDEGLNFLFVTDPMHGNTYQIQKSKLKTRSLHSILQQITYFQSKMNDHKLNYGYSLQATFQDVTQCYGLEFPTKENQVNKQNFKSKCDPRLNKSQTLKLLELLSI